MKQSIFEIKSNVKVAENVYKMELFGDVSEIKNSGQFVNILIDGLYLRRPISVCDVNENVLTIIYKVVGKGTKILSELSSGKLDILTGLGNGYNLDFDGENVLLIGGGVGVPPLYYLAKKLIKKGKTLGIVAKKVSQARLESFSGIKIIC